MAENKNAPNFFCLTVGIASHFLNRSTSNSLVRFQYHQYADEEMQWTGLICSLEMEKQLKQAKKILNRHSLVAKTGYTHLLHQTTSHLHFLWCKCWNLKVEQILQMQAKILVHCLGVQQCMPWHESFSWQLRHLMEAKFVIWLLFHQNLEQ